MKKIDLNNLTIKQWNEFTELMIEETPDIYSIFELFGYDVNRLSVDEFEKLWNEIKTAKLSQSVIKREYQIGDRRFKAHLNISKIKAGQFIDLQTYLSSGKKLEQMLSVFLIPMKRNFIGVYREQEYGVGYDIFETQEFLLNNFPIGAANELSFFFLRTSKTLLQFMKESSTRKLMKAKNKEMKKMKKMYNL